jgi:hypothetical protein
VFLSYLELRKLDKVRKLSDSECYTQWSEPFRFHLVVHIFATKNVLIGEHLQVSEGKFCTVKQVSLGSYAVRMISH